MPITISRIVTQFVLTPNPPIKWGTNCPSNRPGVYIVCVPSVVNPYPLDMNVINYWCNNTLDKTFTDRTRLSLPALVAELQKHWIDNESIVYVGKATNLRKRIYQFYGTPLGRKRPHAGGYWVLSLQNLNMFDVYWFEHPNQGRLELDILRYFSANVACRSQLCLPYANLELKKGQRKTHIVRRPKF